MLRKYKAPHLHRSTIKVGRILGESQHLHLNKAVRRAKIVEPNGKVFRAAVKPNPYEGEGPHYKQRSSIAHAQAAWRAFERAGLPVPSFSRVRTKKGPHYLATFMEDVQAKYGKLEDCHVQGQPVLLRKLSLRADAPLIRNLAHDLAEIYSLGFMTRYVDFWHFYRDPQGKRQRVILDFNSFYKSNPLVGSLMLTSLQHNLYDIGMEMAPRAFNLFLKEFKRRYRGPVFNFKELEHHLNGPRFDQAGFE